MQNNDLRKNASGYLDPTSCDAISNPNKFPQAIFSKTKLKPCPFCGSNALLFRRPMKHQYSKYGTTYEYYIECDNRDCSVRPRTRLENDISLRPGSAIASAVTKWNKRNS